MTAARLEATATPRNQRRPNPLQASAMRITKRNYSRFSGKARKDDRAREAWEMYRLVGEHRFLVNTLAGRMGQARLFVGKLDPDDVTSAPEVIPDEDPNKTMVDSVLDGFGNSPAERSGLVGRCGQNLTTTGDGWYVGIPRDLLADELPTEAGTTPSWLPMVDRTAEEESGDPNAVYAKDLVWRFMSTTEVDTSDDDVVKLRVNATDTKGQITVDPDQIILIRVWRPDPEEWWRADSPTLSSLPVLRELVGLTMHVSAQIDSRLAGAGVLLVADKIKQSVLSHAGVEADGEDDDPFVDALIEMMITPISDRSNASAVVPGVWTVPLAEGEKVTDMVAHIKFSTPLDAEARQLREEAIRRLALGMDAPPELLLGMATLNHWGAWLVREDVIVTHVEPPLAIMCDALTSQYLWPVLIENGMSEDEAHQYVIWYSVKHLIARPDRLKDALALHAAGVISDAVLRREAGYNEDDAPPEDLTIAQRLVLDMIAKTPSLAETITIPVLVEQIELMLAGQNPDAEANPGSPEAETTPEPADTGGVPDTAGDTMASSGDPVYDAIARQVMTGQYGPLDIKEPVQ